MVKALEQQGAALVEKMAAYASKAAITLEQVLKEAFEKIKRTLAGIGRTFKAKLKALKDKRRTPPNGGTGFVEKMKEGAVKAGKEIEVVVEKLVNGCKALVGRAKEIIVKVATLVEKSVTDIGRFISDAAKEAFDAVKTISETGIKEAKNVVEDLEPTHEMDGSFSHSHGLAMAGGAAIAVFDPVLIGSFILGAGIIAGANAYEP